MSDALATLVVSAGGSGGTQMSCKYSGQLTVNTNFSVATASASDGLFAIGHIVQAANVSAGGCGFCIVGGDTVLIQGWYVPGTSYTVSAISSFYMTLSTTTLTISRGASTTQIVKCAVFG